MRSDPDPPTPAPKMSPLAWLLWLVAAFALEFLIAALLLRQVARSQPAVRFRPATPRVP